MKYIKLILVSLVVFMSSCSNSSMIKELNAYKDYYKATEALLDTLELEYNWVDSFDPYEYYEAVENLRN